MKQISNRHYQLIISKLPTALSLAKSAAATTRQQEDLRLLSLMLRSLSNQGHKPAHYSKTIVCHEVLL